jgi:hypothetical protein
MPRKTIGTPPTGAATRRPRGCATRNGAGRRSAPPRPELEAEARATAAAPRRYLGGRPPQHPPGRPRPAAQRNFTDPDSRIMIGRDRFVQADNAQADNAQAAVDRRRQIILAHRLSNNPDDHAARVALSDALSPNTGRKPAEISGDAGFGSEANRAALGAPNIRAYLATGPGHRPRRSSRRRRAPVARRPAGASQARQAQTRRPPQPISPATADRRAGLRPDQAGQAISPIAAARHRQGRGRMGPDPHRSQPQQARHRVSKHQRPTSPLKQPPKTDTARKTTPATQSPGSPRTGS